MVYEQRFESSMDAEVIKYVAAIVKAFKEANIYLNKIRERRKTRLPPRGLVVDSKSMNDLAFSLARGQDVVRSQYERDYRRLGQTFATGDWEAANELKGVLSQLHCIVIENLKTGYQHDQHVDFLWLQDISDDCQDQAMKFLIQLHQRLLTQGDIEEIVNGNPYGQRSALPRKPEVLAFPRPPSSRSASDPRMQGLKGKEVDRSITLDIRRPSPRRIAGNLPTPEVSPSQEEEFFTRQTSPSANNPFRRPKPQSIPIYDRQVESATLPTPPADKMLAPPGPPPNIPLPPAPASLQRQKRREEILEFDEDFQLEQPRKDSETEPGLSPLDRSFSQAEEVWRNPWEGARPAKSRYEFEEPHPGTPVDPSRIDERPPSSPAISFRAQISPIDVSQYPPATSPARRFSPASPSLPPFAPRFGSSSSAAGSPPDRLEPMAGSSNNRLSVVSTGTLSSLNSAASSVSALSRTGSSSASSSTSWPENPVVSNAVAMPYVARTKSFARVPPAIYETPSQTGSQTTLKTAADPRRGSAPDQANPASPVNLQSLPPVPPIPVDSPRPLDGRNSVYSAHSTSSGNSAPTQSVLPTRIIPSAITDATDSKLYLPSDKNKYGGICKSAWRAQIGDFKKAYSAEKRPAGIATNRMVDAMKCRNCDFSGRVVTDSNGRKVADRKLLLAKDTGLAYRWDFLFKSHLALKGGASSVDAEYGCMFCCVEGKGTPVFKGMNAFISHTAEHRPGGGLQVPDVTVADRMEALVGRIMSVEERFEVAFPVVELQNGIIAFEGPPPGLASDQGSIMSRTTSRSAVRAA